MNAFVLLLAVVTISGSSDSELADDPFLEPYVAQLREETPKEALDKITVMSASDLVSLHLGYGMWIRNKWIHGNRESQLVEFFRARGVEDPDSMSMVLIHALWLNLNEDLAPDERARLAALRVVVAERRATFHEVSVQCTAQLASSRTELEACYDEHGLPTSNPMRLAPFEHLIVAASGAVGEIVFDDDSSPNLRKCLRPIIEKYRFSSFEHDQALTLFVYDFPGCRVTEIDTLY